MAYPGEHPVFDGQNTTDYNVGPTASSYLVFDGLEMKNAASENILFWGGNNRTINNCIIHNAQLNCVQFHNGAHDDVIQNCTIYDWNLHGFAVPSTEWSENYAIHCIQYGTNYSQHITIHNNEMYMATTPPSVTAVASRWSAIMIENAHANVTGNRIHDIQDCGICVWRPVPNQAFHIDDNVIWNMQGYGIAMDINGYATASLEVCRNILHDVATGNPSRLDINAMRFRGANSGALCANNLIYNVPNGHNGLRLDSGDNNSHCVNVQLIQNTVAGGDAAFSIVQTSTGIQLISNIAKGNAADLDISGDSTVTQSHNLLGGTADPQFANPAAGDYHLKVTSPAIDSAEYRTEAPTDLEGHAAYDVASVTNTGSGTITYRDRGAYEFVQDGQAPGAVTALAVTSADSDAVSLGWTAPGDDGAVGIASQYDIRYSTSPINTGNWAAATQAVGEPAPAAAGTAQSFIVTGLAHSATYYFAIEASDEAGNWSGLSNSPGATTQPTQVVLPAVPDSSPVAILTASWDTTSGWGNCEAGGRPADDVPGRPSYVRPRRHRRGAANLQSQTGPVG